MAGGGRSVVRVAARSSIPFHPPHLLRTKPEARSSKPLTSVLEYFSHWKDSIADSYQARVYADVNEKLGRGWYDYGESKRPALCFLRCIHSRCGWSWQG
jgi:hypothetical protein